VPALFLSFVPPGKGKGKGKGKSGKGKGKGEGEASEKGEGEEWGTATTPRHKTWTRTDGQGLVNEGKSEPLVASR
jgi:hypothetical protein